MYDLLLRVVQFPCSADAGEKVVAEAVGYLGHGVGAERGNDHQVCPLSQLDMENWVPSCIPGAPFITVSVHYDLRQNNGANHEVLFHKICRAS